ncbi:phage holin family protein [Campylobacter sp. RM16191]|uniref:phage holin family protein n=1 Tax=Campylobacter sp. RM16191 TaxID=1705728 RepID=UPI001474E8C5|nr:phage holin family protein [Campylobacter sp. RM16191]
MTNDFNIVKEMGIYFWVLVIGLIGGLLNIGSCPSKSTGHKAANLIVGTASSMFLGWISFEIVDHIYQSEKVALAACGFFAWKGAEWINALLDKVIDSRLKKRDDWYSDRYSDYDYTPPIPRNEEDMNKTYKELE